ncbi:hypothetical protein [Cohnella caldifontis]|uniref:hypothetical protein n=1 Tax=Cohnella caldifontis TaxID=3027471 RepID=UPI0023EAD48F|nr:hypothetical protein [Cohnella sp. YIM B05605]
MLIDEQMPQWQLGKRNRRSVDLAAPPPISRLLEIDFGESPIIRLLFLFRGLPRRMLTLEGFLNAGFILLDRTEDEIVMGLVAQPWKLTGNIRKMDPERFQTFDQPDYVKVAWNFHYERRDGRVTAVGTETRIRSTSAKAARRFAAYWRLIGFFSGVIRSEMLRIVCRSLSRGH